MTTDKKAKPTAKKRPGPPVDQERRAKAVRANNTITVLPNLLAVAIVSCVAYGKEDDARRQIKDAVLKARRKEALALARVLAAFLAQKPRWKKLFVRPFPAPTKRDERDPSWIELQRGLLDLEEMMNQQTITTSAYRSLIEQEVPQLANPKNAKEKDELRREVDAVKQSVREIAKPFERAREERKRRIRGK